VQKPPLAKRILALLLGMPAMLLGFWRLFMLTKSTFVIGMHNAESYFWGVYAICVSGYCIFLGIISLRFAILGLSKSRLGITWWRVIIGTLLIVGEVHGQMTHNENLLNPKNAAEGFGMWTAVIAIFWLALWLIVSGIRTRNLPVAPRSADPAAPQQL